MSSGPATVEDLKEAYMMGMENKNELTQMMLKQKGWPNDKIVAVLNSLIHSRACVPRKTASGQLTCRVREQDVVARLKSLGAEDYQVYCCVEESGNNGIWTADIRKATNLQQHVIQKAVKNLSEVKRIIKQVKSIQHKNRKLYMLSSLEPSVEVAGGSFYSNGEFDTALVEQLRETICTILRNGQQFKFPDICSYVRSAGLGRDLSDEDLRTVLRTLELEQQVVQISSAGGDISYVWCRWLPDLEQLSALPCSSCQVFEECTRGGGGRVRPENCEYLSYWMSHDFNCEAGDTQAADSSPN